MRTIAVGLGVFLWAAASAVAADANSRMQDVSFVAQVDGTTQKYVLILPEGFDANRPHDLLVALHGHGSDRWQFARDGRSECRAARDAAERHDMIYVSPDYRAAASWMGAKAEADVAQIIDDLKKEHRVDKVIVAGASMGGMSCLALAARRPEMVDGVVSMNGLANLLEYANESFLPAIAKSYGGTKAEIPAEYKARSAEYWPERLTMPIALTAGGKDEAVPAASVLRLADVLKKLGRPVLMVYRETGGHSTNYEDATRALEFVIEKARAAGAGASRCVGGAASRPALRTE